MKKAFTLAGYGLATALMMTLMVILTPSTVDAENPVNSVTVHIGQSVTKNYTTNTKNPAVFTSQNTAIVTVTQAAVSVNNPTGFCTTQVTYISVTPGATTVVFDADGNKQSIPVTVQDHVWKTEYTTDEESTCIVHGSESIHCSVCDAIKPGSSRELPLAAHIWEDLMTVDVEPTYFKPGSESFHCRVCGAIDEDSVTEIPKMRLEKAKIKSLKNPKPDTTVLKMKKIEGPNGFTVCYGFKKDFSDAKPHHISSRSVKIKNLVVGKKYYFRVRAVLKKKNKTAYGKWSKTKSIVIKK